MHIDIVKTYSLAVLKSIQYIPESPYSQMLKMIGMSLNGN